jgi:ascorbate PTS system EIIB component
VKIVTISGAGLGSSGVLKVAAERALRSRGLDADVVAADLATIGDAAADAQIILTSGELVAQLPKTFADVIVVDNPSDTDELGRKLAESLE